MFLDLLVAVAPAMLLSMLPGVFVPMDRTPVALPFVAMPLALAALAYIALGSAVFPNTYGRLAMGIRVVDAGTGRRPSLGQALVRTLTVGLWPVEAALIAFSRSGRRLGDRWADTDVVHYTPAVRTWQRVVPGVAALALACVPMLLMPAVMGRMDISHAATAYARQELRAEPLGAPREVLIVNDTGTVNLRMPDQHNVRVHLLREGETWRGHRIEAIPPGELGAGFSIVRRTSTARRETR